MSGRTRRQFLGAITATALAPAMAPARTSAAAAAGKRLMTMDLVCGAIGVKVDQAEAVDLAIRHGFESVGAQGADLVRMTADQLSSLVGLMKSKNLVWGAANLPVDFRRDDETFRKTGEGFRELAQALTRAGVTRVGTWLMPASDTLTYRAYFDVVAKRLRETARVLEGEGGLRLGLEYVGPKTAWASRRYPFIHTLAETRDLIGEIGQKNVGYVLDSWHWFLAGDTVDDIRTLNARDVVAVDLNDAPAGIPKDQQVDNARELPLATGVIPALDFLKALRDMGYDGPVRAEPFNKALNETPREAAVAATAAAMKRAIALVD